MNAKEAKTTAQKRATEIKNQCEENERKEANARAKKWRDLSDPSHPSQKKRNHPNHGPNIFDLNCAGCRKLGMWKSKVWNRRLLDRYDPAYPPEGRIPENSHSQKRLNPKYGYHTVKIKKGVLGEISKIEEELQELKDAEKQGVKILIAVELSDLFGAIREYAKKYGLKMAKLTRKAFEGGFRK